MTDLVEMLTEVGKATDLDVLAAALTATPSSAVAPMPVAERNVWLAGASPSARKAFEEADASPKVQRAQVAALQVKTLQRIGEISTDAAGIARLLGKTESTVSRMTKRGVLRPFRLGSRRLYPLWQVQAADSGSAPRPVPHVAAVCDVADAIHLHPLSLDAFLRIPTGVLDDQPPLHWLIAGGQVEPVVDLIDALRR